jgi:molybdate transport system permease protein
LAQPTVDRHTPIRLPGWLWLLAWAGAAFTILPLVGLVVGVPWRRFIGLITSPTAWTALSLSLRTATAATLLSIVLGVPLAALLTRTTLPGRRLLRALILLPLVLPPVVAGLALLQVFGRRGLIGQYLNAFGITVAFTTLAVVLAEAFVSMPFLVLSLSAALESADQRTEQVAATLGAGPTRIFFTVTLPALLPALASGTVLTFARALGEFGATLTFAGSLGGVTRTLPLEVYLQREIDDGSALALSVLLMVVGFAVVLAVYGRRPR